MKENYFLAAKNYFNGAAKKISFHFRRGSCNCKIH